MPRPKGGDEPSGRPQGDLDPRRSSSFSASGGAEGSSRCAGMSLPYGPAEPEPEGRSVPAGIAIRAEL